MNNEKVEETPDGEWGVLCVRTDGSRFGPARALLKRGGSLRNGTEGHVVTFDEEGAKAEAERLNADAAEDRKNTFGAYGHRHYEATRLDAPEVDLLLDGRRR